LENNEGSEKEQLLDQIKKLTLENERLKQEIAKLRGVKRSSSSSMDSMSTKLKEALRE
jgi:cell division septum initiation protein DivIVA